MLKISVIIPYFQKSSGILCKAIHSILLQGESFAIDIIIVDDESPMPPTEDLAQLKHKANVTLKVLHQSNGGPGAARNLGLDNISDDTDYIAFLDSDDEWEENHLRSAIAALEQGFDFYFSDYTEIDSQVGELLSKGRIVPANHIELAPNTDVFQFRDDMINQILTANIIETSTVVYRRSIMGHLRFRSAFRNAYEDHLFWLAAARASEKFVFSIKIECRYGRGINIYRSSGLGSDRFLPKLIDQTKFRIEIERSYIRTPLQLATSRKLAKQTREAFVAELLHRLRRRAYINWQLVMYGLRLDPCLIFLFIPITIKIMLKK